MADHKHIGLHPIKCTPDPEQVPFEKDVLETAVAVALIGQQGDLAMELKRRFASPATALGPQALALVFNVARHKSGNGWKFEKEILETAAWVATDRHRPDLVAELKQCALSGKALKDPHACALAISVCPGWDMTKPTAQSDELDPQIQLALKLSMTSDEKAEQLKTITRSKIRSHTGVSLLFCKKHDRYFEPPDTCGPCTKASLLRFANKVADDKK